MTKIFNKPSEKTKRRKLRKDLSPAEIKLWKSLRNKQNEGYKFRRQYSVGRYVVDFYCASVKLAIEIDGKSHDVNTEVREYDRQRQKDIESFGIRFLRFSNWEVYNNLQGVLLKIRMVCQEFSEDLP